MRVGPQARIAGDHWRQALFAQRRRRVPLKGEASGRFGKYAWNPIALDMTRLRAPISHVSQNYVDNRQSCDRFYRLSVTPLPERFWARNFAYSGIALIGFFRSWFAAQEHFRAILSLSAIVINRRPSGRNRGR
jgi:hypothetical protein